MGKVPYLRGVALNMMGQMRVNKGTEMKVGETVHDLYNRHEFALRILLRRMRPETLGKIIACAKPSVPGSRKTSVKDVDPWLRLTNGGPEILRQLASAVIIAEIADIIEEQQK